VVVFERAAGLRHSQDPPSFTEVAAAWHRLTGEDIHGGTPLWVSWFTDSSRQASEYRRGRVFVAGDAAHVHMPIGGQGMSAGIQDAVNLGWKLAAQLRGHAPAGLLDTYHSERHPVGARILANTLAQRILYLGGDELEPMRSVLAELLAYPAVQRHLVGMVTGLDIRYDAGPGEHPLLGRRVPSVELVSEDAQPGKTTSEQWLHAARGVLYDLAGDVRLREAAAGWAGRVDVVTAAPHSTGTPFDGLAGVLARPDGYIAWAGPAEQGSEGLAGALTRWFGPPLAEPGVRGADQRRAEPRTAAGGQPGARRPGG
jgi:bifunctional hydroxylase/dehydrase